MIEKRNRKNFTKTRSLGLLLLCLFLLTIEACQTQRGSQPDLQEDENYQQGLVHFNNREYGEALKKFSASIDENKNNKMALYYRGHTYQELGLLNLASKDFRKVTKIDDKYAEAWAAYGFAESELGNLDKSIQYYDKAISLNAALPTAWNNRGIAYYRKGDYKKAISDFTMALQLDSSFALAWNNRGSAMYYHQNVEAHERDIRRAILDFTRAIQLDSSLGMAWRNRGIAHNLLEEYDQALENLNTAIELQPRDPLSFINRGKAFVGLTNYYKAIEDYRHSLMLKPGWAEAYIAMGDANRKNGDFDQAIQDYWTAIDLKDPNQKGRAYLGLAALFAAQGDKDAMFDYLERARKEGFFKHPANRNMLQTESAFDAYQNDNVFRNFVRIAK